MLKDNRQPAGDLREQLTIIRFRRDVDRTGLLRATVEPPKDKRCQRLQRMAAQLA